MPTTFAADWTKAKAAFASATKAKKPSATFLGVFNKGTGIGASLKSADAAKNVGELGSAMKSFKPAFEDYAKILDKAIADPKITDAAAKPAYIAAAAKLKKDLMDIYTRAGIVARTLDGAAKKVVVDPAVLKAGAEKQRYEAVKPQIAKLQQTLASLKTNRQELDKSSSALIDQFGNRVAELRPKGDTGGKLEDFLKDAEAKKIYEEAKSRFETMHKTYAAYLENFDLAVRIHEGLAEDYKDEVADLIAGKSPPPPVFSDTVATELKKKPGRRAIDVKAAEMDAAGSKLKPRVLEVRAATLSKISVQLVAFTTAALKAHEEGLADRAKTNLANAHGELDKMEAIVDPIQQDYEAEKQTVADSKDVKDIMQKLNKIAGIHKKAIQTVNDAQRKSAEQMKRGSS